MTGPYIDNTALFNGFRQGEPLAEKQVFQRYFRPLCLYSEHITSQLPASEDIVAEALEKVWGRRQDFDTLENLKAFLYRIVRNASLNFKERQATHRRHHEQIRYILDEGAVTDEVLEREILRVELLHEIYKEIENLPDRCGQIFKMIFVHSLTTEQIAAQLSINVQTVRTQKARAIQLIRVGLLRRNRIQAGVLLAMLLEFTC